MKSRKIAGDAGAETRVVILESGEEAFAALTKFANEAGITAASLTAIGAFENATVGWFDFEKRTYKKIKIAEALEVVLTDTPVKLRRKKRADLGIALIDVEAGKC